MSIVSNSSNQVHKKTTEDQPPACNTGVKTDSEQRAEQSKSLILGVPRDGLTSRKARTGTKIDWLSVTLPYRSKDFCPQELTRVGVDEVAMHSYDIARRFADGRLELRHSSREDMGIHIQFPGKTLEIIAKTAKISDLELLRWYLERGAKIRRLDVALDAWDSGIDLLRLHETFHSGLATTKAKAGSLVQSTGDRAGTTVYVGSRQSEAFARYYDKAAEQGVIGDWLRFELQFKDSKAIQAADGLLNSIAPDQYIIGLIRGHCDFPTIRAWNDIMDVEPTEISRAKKSGSDTLTWLMDTCAPSLAREIHLSLDEPVLHNFLERVMSEVERLRENGQ